MKFTKIVSAVFALLFAMQVWAGTININTANVSAIAEAMTGVGPKKAEAIVAYRKSNGQFKSLDELAKVKGISTRTIEKNRDRVTVK